MINLVFWLHQSKVQLLDKTRVPAYYKLGSRDGAVVRALAPHQCDPGFDYRTRRRTWVEFVAELEPKCVPLPFAKPAARQLDESN